MNIDTISNWKSNATVFAQSDDLIKQLYRMKLQEKKSLNQEINDLEQYKSFLSINHNWLIICLIAEKENEEQAIWRGFQSWWKWIW